MEDEVLGKAYDARLMRRLLGYLRPYWRAVLVALAHAAQLLVGEQAGVVAIGPDRRQGIAADPFHALERGLLRGEVRLERHDAGHVPLAGAERAGTGAAQRLPRPVAEMAVIPANRHAARRLVELVDQPVLVIGLDRKIDYANSAAGRAFDEKLAKLEGMELTRLPGGAAVINAMEEILRHGDVVSDRVVSTNPLSRDQHLAHCAVVRDRDGNPSRIIMVLKAQEGAWWKRLFRAPEETSVESV